MLFRSLRLLGASCLLAVGLALSPATVAAAEPATGSLRVGVFRVDATPPLGSPVAYAAARKIEDPLFARGIVLLGAGKPIVLCAVDWIGIGNGGHDVWRERLAEAAGTDPSRVAVHVLHQHDGVRCDFSTEELLAPYGLQGLMFDVPFVRKTIDNVAKAVSQAAANSQPLTHLGIGQAKVDKVASNRRILGPDGKMALFRMSSWKIRPSIVERLSQAAKEKGYQLSPLDPEAAQAAPEGLIDPIVKMISLWNGDQPVVCLSYYAVHPQSYFGEGDVTAEFVGLARAAQEQAQGDLPLIHFNGAGGNIAAGKYNDGTPETRVVLTQRMADGLRRAWQDTKKTPIAAADVDWRVVGVQLPPGDHLNAETLRATLADDKADNSTRFSAARKLAFLARRQAKLPTELSCLKLKDTYILHMPGELFVEYQLAAQQMRPNDTVCMAAYGDYGSGYIGTEIAYWQGGYETEPTSSNTAPSVEKVLLKGIRELLQPQE